MMERFIKRDSYWIASVLLLVDLLCLRMASLALFLATAVYPFIYGIPKYLSSKFKMESLGLEIYPLVQSYLNI